MRVLTKIHFPAALAGRQGGIFIKAPFGLEGEAYDSLSASTTVPLSTLARYIIITRKEILCFRKMKFN